MKIMLINPNFDDTRLNVEPIGIMSIASYLETYGHTIEIIDLFLEKTRENLVNILFENQIPLIGITVCSSCAPEAIRLAAELKQLSPNSFIIFGGPHATFAYESILTKNIQVDAVCIGDGELAMKSLVDVLENNDSLDKVPNIAFLKNGCICKTHYISLDQNEFPTPKHKAFSCSSEKSNQYIHSVNTTRGCPFHCTFCGLNVNEKKRWRCRNISSVDEEIAYLVDNLNITQLNINDADFFASPKHTTAVIELLAKYPIITEVFLACRVDSLLRCISILPKLLKGRHVSIEIGVESYSQSQLDRYDKKIPQGKIEQLFSKLAELHSTYKFTIVLDLLIFDPFVTVEELRETLDFLRNNNLMLIKNASGLFHNVQLLPKTEMRERSIQEGLAYDNDVMISGWIFKDKRVATVFSYMKRFQNDFFKKLGDTLLAAKEKMDSCLSTGERIRCIRTIKRLNEISFNFFSDILDAVNDRTTLNDIFIKYNNEIESLTKVVN